MNELRENIEAGVEAMMEHMRDDYRGWSRLGEADESGIRARMSEEYADELHYTTGSKYIKVTSKNSVSAFVVNTTKVKWLLIHTRHPFYEKHYKNYNILTKDFQYASQWKGRKQTDRKVKHLYITNFEGV